MMVSIFYSMGDPIKGIQNDIWRWGLAINKFNLFSAAFLLIYFFNASNAQAISGGNMSLGVGFSSVSADQSDMNGAIDAAVAAGATVKDLGSAMDFYADWSYRFSSSIFAIVFRPSYFTQSVSGSGASGSYDYSLSGYTLFPIFRFYPLENSFIKFYMHTGLGYGSLYGDITAGAKSLKFKGSAFGAIGGIGVNFCFVPSHCVTLEGNLRYLPIERNIASGGNCSASGDIPGVSQCGVSSEVERNSSDLKTTMSGVQGLVGYSFIF
jgi:hypothetical protein